MFCTSFPSACGNQHQEVLYLFSVILLFCLDHSQNIINVVLLYIFRHNLQVFKRLSLLKNGVLFQKGQRDSGNPQFCYWIAYDSFLPHTIISTINQFSVISTKISILYTHISFDGKNPNLGCLSSSTVPFVAYLHVAVATSLFCLPFFVCFDRSLNALKGRIHDLRWHPSV